MGQTELNLSEEDRSTIEAIRSKGGSHQAREVNRALGLSCLGRDIPESQIMAVLGLCRRHLPAQGRLQYRLGQVALRLKFKGGQSHQQIAGALGISKEVVTKYVGLAVTAGLDWPAFQP